MPSCVQYPPAARLRSALLFILDSDTPSSLGCPACTTLYHYLSCVVLFTQCISTASIPKPCISPAPHLFLFYLFTRLGFPLFMDNPYTRTRRPIGGFRIVSYPIMCFTVYQIYPRSAITPISNERMAPVPRPLIPTALLSATYLLTP